MLEGEQILCISTVDWDPLWTRKQQVMSRLPKSNRILYVEPPITLISPFKDKTLWAKWKSWRQGIRQLNENIYLYSPPVILPFGNMFRVINKLNQWWQSLYIKKALAQLGMTQPVLWTYMPNTVDMLGKYGEKFLVYDCVDEHSEYTGFINKETALQMEDELLKQCGIVFVTAQGLYDAKKDLNKNTVLLPNAANVEHFMQAQAPETEVPKDIANIPHPIIGFIGVIQDWIDLGLIEAVAKSNPKWSVVLVGPIGTGIDVSSLAKLSNVYMLGRKDLKLLPGYLKAFDVCLNPFKINELTKSVSPLKFYEYLASGKPIVSVDMPEVRRFADVVEIADSPADFNAKVAKALAEETPEKKEARLKRAHENSWDSRVQIMMQKIEDTVKGGHQDDQRVQTTEPSPPTK